MSDARKQIRAAVVARLENVIAAVGDRVFPNRTRVTARSELPAIFVYMMSGTAEVDTVAPRSFKYETLLEIEIVENDREDLEDRLDDFSEIVAAKIAEDVTFGGCAAECDEAGFEYRKFEDGQRENAAALALQYNLVYYQTRPEADAVDDFETAHVEYGENADGDPQPVDEFELEQDP